MSVALQMKHKLAQAFAAQSVDVIDDSARHAGHAGAHRDGESHFKVVIVAEYFSGMSRLTRHRAVYEVLQEELVSRVHALNITALTPQEAGK